jgi:hypothetical protein
MIGLITRPTRSPEDFRRRLQQAADCGSCCARKASATSSSSGSGFARRCRPRIQGSTHACFWKPMRSRSETCCGSSRASGRRFCSSSMPPVGSNCSACSYMHGWPPLGSVRTEARKQSRRRTRRAREANIEFDASTAEPHELQPVLLERRVYDSRRRGRRRLLRALSGPSRPSQPSYSYHRHTADWRPGANQGLEIDRETFLRLDGAGGVIVVTKRGALGYEWIESFAPLARR